MKQGGFAPSARLILAFSIMWIAMGAMFLVVNAEGHHLSGLTVLWIVLMLTLGVCGLAFSLIAPHLPRRDGKR